MIYYSCVKYKETGLANKAPGNFLFIPLTVAGTYGFSAESKRLPKHGSSLDASTHGSATSTPKAKSSPPMKSQNISIILQNKITEKSIQIIIYSEISCSNKEVYPCIHPSTGLQDRSRCESHSRQDRPFCNSQWSIPENPSSPDDIPPTK